VDVWVVNTVTLNRMDGQSYVNSTGLKSGLFRGHKYRRMKIGVSLCSSFAVS